MTATCRPDSGCPDAASPRGPSRPGPTPSGPPTGRKPRRDAPWSAPSARCSPFETGPRHSAAATPVRHRHARQQTAHLVVGPEDAHLHLPAQRHRRAGTGAGEVPDGRPRPARPPVALAARHLQRAARKRHAGTRDPRPRKHAVARQRTATEGAAHRHPPEAGAVVMARHAVRRAGHAVYVAWPRLPRSQRRNRLRRSPYRPRRARPPPTARTSAAATGPHRPGSTAPALAGRSARPPHRPHPPPPHARTATATPSGPGPCSRSVPPPRRPQSVPLTRSTASAGRSPDPRRSGRRGWPPAPASSSRRGRTSACPTWPRSPAVAVSSSVA